MNSYFWIIGLAAITGGVLSAEEAESEPASIEVATIDANAPVESIQERYPDGKVKIRREVTLDSQGNYVNHGTWALFDTTEKEVATGEFSNNRRVGNWMRIYNWGDSPLFNQPPYSMLEAPFTSKAEFKDGELHGKWTIFDAQDRVASEWNYKEGVLDGTAKWFYGNGEPMEEIEYADGLIDGSHKMWSESGDVLHDDTYQDGRKLASKSNAYPSGAPHWEGMFLHEKHEIVRGDDWWKAIPVSYTPTGRAERHGRFSSWYENGEKKFEGMFENDTRSGEFTWWHENTQVAAKGSYKNNERHGHWTWWHENGLKAIQGQYDEGSLSGQWSYWASDGKLERRMNYDGQHDEPVSLHAVPSTEIPGLDDSHASRIAKRAAITVDAAVK